MGLRATVEALEVRNLLSTIVGQVINDLNGNALRDVGESGISGVSITLDQLNTATGASTPVTTTTTDSSGNYQFNGVSAGTYLVSEQVPTGSLLTFPTAEHSARSYTIQVGPNNTVLGGTLSSSLTAPADNWLASLPAGNYSFPLAGDFMFQFGGSGVAPSRVYFSGQAQVQTQAAVVSPASGDSATTTTVNATMTQLVLHGTISSDQHEQGYLGPITLTLTMPSSGQITSRKDSASLADSNFDINATLEIPNGFGTPTTLHTAVPINFLAREIAQFPAVGGSYQYRGTQPPISLVDSTGAEQGKLYFASLNPLAGYDFGNFTQATVQGRAYIDGNGNGVFDAGDTPLVNQPVILQLTAEVSGPTGEEGEGGTSGSGGPPVGKGEPSTTPVTVYTDSNGLYSFSGLGPGAYTIRQPDGAPLSVTTPNTADHGFTIDTLTSGSSLTYDFVNSFATGQLNQGSAAGYPAASDTIVPNLHLGVTEYANSPGQSSINDGVQFGSALVPGATVPLTITVVVPEGQTAYLSGWLDAHGNNTFAPGSGMGNHGDQIQLSGDPTYSYLSDYVVGAGVHTLSLNMIVPSGLTLTGGQLATYARFRLSTTAGLGPDSSSGPANPDGEVEDIPVSIFDPSRLGVVQGQTFEDVNGDGVHQPGEPGLDGWTVQLVNLDNGQVVATQTSAPEDINLGGSTVTEHGIYHFGGVVPGRYEVRSTPPSAPGASAVTAPASGEGEVVYRFDVTAGETVGSLPSATTPASPGWLNTLPASTDSLFTLGNFMILKGGGGGHSTGTGSTGGSTGTGSTDSGQPIRLSVVGSAQIFHDTINVGGLIPAEITGLQLEGIAVQDGTEGGPPTMLGPVTVKLGLFRSMGTFGASSGSGSGESSDTATFSLYVEFDLTSLGLGIVTNTRPLDIAGTITQSPIIGTTLARQGGGSPIPLRDSVTGAEPLRLVTGSLTTMVGLDYGTAFLGSLSGNVFNDLNADNIRQAGEVGLPGSTVVVEQVLTDGGSTGSSGSSGNGSGETTTPTVFMTRTDANGNWTIGNLVPGTYKVTVIPPASFGVSGGTTVSYSQTVQSQSLIGNINFGNFPINNPPIIAAPPTASTTEGTQSVFSTAGGDAIVVSDPDAGVLPIQLTLQASGGTLSLSQTTGLTFSVGDGTANSKIVVTGTIADLNAALDGMQFIPTPYFSGSANLSVTADDLGNSGFGGAMTATAAVPISVTAVANAPTLTAPDVSGYQGSPVPLGIAAALVDTDGSETLSITLGGLPAGATLSAGTNLGGGNWLLTPDQLAGLTITSPVSGKLTLAVTATSKETSNSSTATTTASQNLSLTSVTRGMVYLDLNANGVRDPGEPGLPGRVVYGDLNGNRILDAGDPTATTDASGQFSLIGVNTNSTGVFEARDLAFDYHYSVEQLHTNADGSLDIGVVPISPIAPVPVVPNPFVATPSTDPNSAYVQSLYKAVLGRAGDDSEVATWLVKLNTGTTQSEVALGFLNSAEHREEQVFTYYDQFLHRAPDPSSVNWVNALQSGVSEQKIVEAFLDSPEYQAAHQDPANFVRDLYLDVLGRQGDPGGQAFWKTELASGMSRQAVEAHFVESSEAASQLVTSFYASYLRRQSDSSSHFWLTNLESSNGSATDVALGFLTSDEFDQRARNNL